MEKLKIIEDQIENDYESNEQTLLFKFGILISNSNSQFLPLVIAATGCLIINWFFISSFPNVEMFLFSFSFLLSSIIFSVGIVMFISAFYEQSNFSYSIIPSYFNLMGQLTFIFFIIGIVIFGVGFFLNVGNKISSLPFLISLFFVFLKSIQFMMLKLVKYKTD